MSEENKNELATIEQEPSLLNIIADAVKEPDYNIDVLERLITAQERVEATEAKKAFNAAMFKFQMDPPIIKKDTPVYGKADKKTGVKPLHYHFAKFEDVWAKVRPALQAVGIVATWYSRPQGESVTEITCMLRHKMGHEEKSTMAGTPEGGGSKNHIQGVGSTDSYLRRYTLLSVCGLVVEGEDTDGAPKDALPETITPAEAAHLSVTMKEKNVTEAEFLEAVRLVAVTDLRADQYCRAVEWINKRSTHNANNT